MKNHKQARHMYSDNSKSQASAKAMQLWKHSENTAPSGGSYREDIG